MAELQYKQINEMINLQHQNNLNTIEDYLDKNFDWRLAVVMETNEAIESYGYKWWKKEVQDIENVKTEMIDVWHFLMSMTLCDVYSKFKSEKNKLDITLSVSSNEIRRFYNKYLTDFEDNSELNTEHFKDIIRMALDYSVKPFSLYLAFFKTISKLGIDLEELHRRYIVKNALNTLRQNYGYKEGTYKKGWPNYVIELNNIMMIDNDIREDNEIALKLIGNIPVTFEHVYSILETYYKDI